MSTGKIHGSSPRKTLILDIETSPHLSWHFGTRNVDIQPIQNVIPSRMICYASRWLGENRTLFFSEYHDDTETMVRAAHLQLDQADVLVTFNGDNFDIPRLYAEFTKLGLPDPSPFTSVDLYKVWKKKHRDAFFSNRLGYIASTLHLTGKLDHKGYFPLWLDMQASLDPDLPAVYRPLEWEAEKRRARAWTIFRRYNKRDLDPTEEMFNLLLPNITNMPHIGLFVGEDEELPTELQCPNGHTDFIKQGFKRTKKRRYQQYQCRECSTWFHDTRSQGGVK